MKFLFIFFVFFTIPISLFSSTEGDGLTVPFKDRIGLHTNSAEWLFMTPNIGIEYSFIQNKYKKYSVLLHGKYNPNSSMNINPELIYNIGGVRAEVRKYHRTHYRSEAEIALDSLDKEGVGTFRGFWRKLINRPYSFLSKNNPRTHRAYYIGPYLTFDKYTLKLTENGYQGYSFGIGAVTGYSVPLYHYKNGSSVDFELGFGVGFAMSMNDKFKYDLESNCYYYTNSNKLHFVPFPIVSDLRVAFVYRLKSIKDQIIDLNQKEIDRINNIYEMHKEYDDEIEPFIHPKGEYYVSSDSIKKWNSIIEEKNAKIREKNNLALQFSGLDSTLLLEELRLYYEYVTIPRKMFMKYKYELPEKEIASISELKNAYLNNLIDKYATINADNGEIEMRLKNAYNNKLTDSIPGVKLLEVMTKAVNELNSYAIHPFNQKYHHTTVSATTVDAIPTVLKVSNGSKGYFQYDFVFGMDSIFVTEQQEYSFKGKNDEIEANNIYKSIRLNKFIKQKRKEQDTLNIQVTSNNNKKKRKRNNKSEKANKNVMR